MSATSRWNRPGHRRRVHPNLGAAALYEAALRRDEGRLAATGPLVVDTGEHTGRSPEDKFIVEEPEASEVWWGAVNQPLEAAAFARLRADVERYLADRETFVQDLSAGADPAFRLPVRVVSELAWSALFARNLFLPGSPDRPPADDIGAGLTGFRVLHAPLFQADPRRHGTKSETAIAVSFAERLVVIAGTRYAGEIKKSIFSVLQFLLPRLGVSTMHCSCNAGPDGESALFFGLSGTGKTTLSTEPGRTLIGDDEHGWTDRGIFNFEGGSYAKVINLSAEAEPAIFAASHRFGTVLENVVLDPETRELRLTDDAKTENTRAAFPLHFIPGASTVGLADHPRHVIFLTADAFGVLPPVSRLTPDQAQYYFLAGYTSKLAGTERGITEPEATFSAGFGAAFLTLPPVRYAELLGERIARHRPALWLVNTGWTGGPYGVGQRIAIADTRAIVRAILAGALDDATLERDPIFGLNRPTACPDVAPTTLDPRATWADPAAYDEAARRLAAEFRANMDGFAGTIPDAILAAGPIT